MSGSARRFGLGAMALAAASCGSTQTSPPGGRVGASIALLGTGDRLAVVNPDQGSVSIVDASSLAAVSTIDVGGEPHALLQLASGHVLVTNYRAGEIVEIDPDAGVVTKRASICGGSYGLAASPDGTWIAVACEWDGSVVRVDTATLASHVLATGLARPHALAVVGSSVVVAEFTGGHVVRIDANGNVTRTSLVPSSAPYRPAVTNMDANLAAAVVPAFGKLFVAHELVNHTGDSSVEKISDDYGSVKDGNPKINPAVSELSVDSSGATNLTSTPPLYASFDGGPRAFNGPVAIAPVGDHELLVAQISSLNVAVLDTLATDPKTRAVGSYAVGAGVSGIAVDDAHHVAYVDNAFDGSISKLDLNQRENIQSGAAQPTQTLIRDLPQPYSASARAGRKLFWDASNTHVTPSGVVACATCHPSGMDDGLVWFMHTSSIPLKRRRTPNLCDAHSATAPFHWNGQFATMNDLVSSTITDLMAGDALLVDVGSIQAYVDEMVKAPIAPAQDPAAIARGQTVFESDQAACATCHSGADFTDNQMHAVLAPMSLTSDDDFPMANTPALHGVFFHAPYFHDGRSSSLHDLLTRSDASGHGSTQNLTPSQIDDLATYLTSLP